MKQFLAILMVLVLAMVTFTSCITINNGETTTEEATTAVEEETTEEETTGEEETTAAQNGEDTTAAAGTTKTSATTTKASTTKAATTTKAVTTTKAPIITTPDTGAVWPVNRLTNLVPKPSGDFDVFSSDYNNSKDEAVVVLKAMSNQEALDYVAKLKAAGFTKDGASWDKEEIKIGPTFVSYKAANSNGVTVEFWKTFDTYTLEINDK